MIFRKAGPCVLMLAMFGLSLHSASSDEMARIAKTIATIFTDYYAPKLWKAEHFRWDLEAELAKVTDVSSRGDINDFHKSLRQFFQGTRDYHTGILFAGNSLAVLPISIKYLDGDFYLAHVAPNLESSFPLMPGDKITHFNNIPIKDLAFELMGKLDNPSPTDWAMAAMKLTRRTGLTLDAMEKGSVLIKAERSSRPVTGQLVWDVTFAPMTANQPNSVRINRFTKSLPSGLSGKHKWALENIYRYIDSRSFRASLLDALSQPTGDDSKNPQALGMRESFLPPLGERVIWEADSASPFDAYISLNSDNKLVGFIRINSYVPDASVGTASVYANKFGEIIAKMEQDADILVIDQLNNPGGSVFYLYTLASMLTDSPLTTPRHRFTIDSRDVWEAKEYLKQVDMLIALAAQMPGPIGELEGYPMDMQFLQHMKSYYQFVVDQWNEGKTFTDPYFLYGVDYITPNPKYRFTKKIVLLTNELDFSGGDFFPAIMQDNQRATIVGTTTAGAGGYVLSNTDRNRAGIIQYTYTGSIAIRANGQPLENLGVAPDIEYKMTPIDLATGFSEYKRKVDETVHHLLQ